MASLPPGISLSETPAGKPPAGVKPNLIDPDSLGGAIVTVNAVFLALMLIFITLRTYTKAVLLQSLWWDDCKLPVLALCSKFKICRYRLNSSSECCPEQILVLSPKTSLGRVYSALGGRNSTYVLQIKCTILPKTCQIPTVDSGDICGTFHYPT